MTKNDFPRFFVHNDGNFMHVCPPPLTPEQFIHETVGWLRGTACDAIVCHMFSAGGSVPIYKSSLQDAQPVYPDKTDGVNMWKYTRNLKSLFSFEKDPWKEAIDSAHYEGKVFWATMRINDGHPSSYGLNSRFNKDNPDIVLGNRCASDHHASDPDGNPMACPHLDFSLEKVRKHQLALIEDLCSQYELDGFEWDFTRDAGHNFPKDMKEDKEEVLTKLLKDAKAILNHISQEQNREISFGVRVPGTLEACHMADIAIESWIAEGIVDVVTPSVYYDTCCELPFEEFVALAENTRCRIYASVTEGVGPGRYRPAPIEAIRAATQNAWSKGIDGLSLFNYHHHQISNLQDDARVLHEMGNSETLVYKDKLYMLAGPGVQNQSRFFGRPYVSAHEHQLPREFSAKSLELSFDISDDLQAAKASRYLSQITLTLDLVDFTGEEKLQMLINDSEVDFSTAHFDVSDQYAFNWNGQRGRYAASIDLTRSHDIFNLGKNTLSFKLLERPADILNPLILYSLRLKITFHAVPIGVQ